MAYVPAIAKGAFLMADADNISQIFGPAMVIWFGFIAAIEGYSALSTLKFPIRELITTGYCGY